jgi:membrane protein implicated in regulation of membrane protease activity
MDKYKIFRLTCIFLLWIGLCYIVISSAKQIDFYVIFAVVASGIIVFVPLYKRYVREKKK